ncbi:AAA family ATPase [Arthrobacter sp. MYb227]|uniref:RNA-binding domain-containing protein n=1 Tax=Arthrobacter sp. MYb227 TaxID=1848601 RepID=UPI000CFCAEB8|nr:RNA-binding domain-containing protein [Arthrobacter sp. MYb227]PQZ94700.1 AAA family ATPase [Arthrobacter sp. MYb227]
MAWTPERLQLLLTQLRSTAVDFTHLEVREASKGCPDLKETLSAFGNAPEGGTIILGINHIDGFRVTGVEDPASLEALVTSQARTSVTPKVQVACEQLSLDEKAVLIVKVEGLAPTARPCRTTQGQLAYLRQSDGQYRISEPETQQLVNSVDRPRQDTRPVDETSIADLDAQLSAAFVAAARATSRRLSEVSDEEVLRFKRVLEPQGGRLTLAGLYALGRYPQQFEPHLSITAVLEPAGNGVPVRVEFDGPLPDLLDSALEWIQHNIRAGIPSGSPEPSPLETEASQTAVRELITNALVHRDLSPHTNGKNVEMRLAAGRLTVSSPGGIWGLSKDQLGWPGAKASVNEFLYEICKFTGAESAERVVDGESCGLCEVRRVLDNAGLRRPEFTDNGVRFTASIPLGSSLTAEDRQWLGGLRVGAQLSEIQKQLLVSMRQGQAWTATLAQSEFGLFDSAEAQEVLQGLVTAGLAHAPGKGNTYVITALSSAASPAIGPVPAGNSPALVGSAPDTGSTRLLTATPIRIPEPIKTSKNAAAILRELGSEPLEVTDISEKTGLTANQIRYALSPLLTSGVVVREGGQGHKITTYSRADF